MLFNSVPYLIFFPVVLALYWLLPSSFRRPLLLVASYIFYMSWLPVYGILIVALSLVNYFIGLMINYKRSLAKVIFIFGIVFNLGMLCYFKYTNFLISSFNELAQKFSPFFGHGATLPLGLLDIILPLGISFFVFEFIHYLTDVYKGDQPIKNPVDFGLFAAFFPSQIAGPIKRYQDFVKQLGHCDVFEAKVFNEGLVLLLQGLFKKIALSDNLAPIANAGFAGAANLGTVDAWIASIAFALQIYFDFSGYTDMGRGSAKMLGFSLPDNFDFPYLASSLSDFWKRWHISLSSWLRDYLYIPLGGGRCSRFQKHRNLLITMLLGGLWHGAAWHFVIWGAFHGAGLVVNHSYDEVAGKSAVLQKFHASVLGKIFSSVLTFLAVLVGWVFFRADNSEQACQILRAMVSIKESGPVLEMLYQSPVTVALVLYSAYASIYSLPRFKSLPVLDALQRKLSFVLPARVVVYASVFLAALGFCPSQPSPFIYFQF
ncbi:MAG: hypothetical protein K2X27_06415 [Candidatus Obscuribacterales bacterium]|nr:hypothetical protein [Candidatus Obscuribacterales bacterium]